MNAVISVLIILCCVILIIAVLIQNPKGGGLASGFQGGSQVMGVRRTADFLERASWVLAIFLFLFSIWATSRINKGDSNANAGTSITKDHANDFGSPAAGANAANPFGTAPQGAGQPVPAPSTPPVK